MTEKELRKLNRHDLLKMLITQAKRSEELQAKLDESKQQTAKEQPANKSETAFDASSVIESLTPKPNGSYDPADEAAAEYIKSVNEADITLMTASTADSYRESEGIIADAKKQAEEIIAQANRKAADIIGTAEAQSRAREDKATKYVDAVNLKIKQLYDDYKELFISMQGIMKESSGERKKADAPEENGGE